MEYKIKKAYIKKLTKIYEQLEELKEQIENDANNVECTADEKEREMTKYEIEKYDRLNYCASEIEDAMQYLQEFAMDNYN